MKIYIILTFFIKFCVIKIQLKISKIYQKIIKKKYSISEFIIIRIKYCST